MKSFSTGETLSGFLSRERIIAEPGFNRWLVPPAALCIHLCIGMAYGFSVFWLPLTRAIGITQPKPYPADMNFFQKLGNTTFDWDKPMLGWMYTLFFVFLGCSAAVFGPWLERAGPRKAGFISTLCWCGGLVISALGIYVHQLWIIWLGAGVIGGIGLGLGYISPVSTLIKWFPDKRGMATGMAIMGFGGGAMIGSPLADTLMKYFATPDSVGVWQAFLVLAGIYFAFMMVGTFAYRVPSEGWKPDNWAPQDNASSMIARGYITVDVAWRTRQFWLLWMMLCLNVSAGIGVIGMASPMLQEIFGGRLLGLPISFDQLDKDQLGKIAAMAAGFTGLLSLFNIGGRFFWSSLSDRLGRKITFYLFFILGFVLYALVPLSGKVGSVAFFVFLFCLILTMYGGGFATIPAYLADLFGTKMVGAIHGRLLTAWSVAGILGPVLVNYINEAQIAAGTPKSQAYDVTMFILAGLLLGGMVCNFLVKPLPDKCFHHDESITSMLKLQNTSVSSLASSTCQAVGTETPVFMLVLFWLFVGLPLLWGTWQTLVLAVKFFQ
ncbi:MAG: OFA family MFS transporter [Planctomycetia bacterium]